MTLALFFLKIVIALHYNLPMDFQLKIIHEQDIFTKDNKVVLQKAFQMYQDTWKEIFKDQKSFSSDTFLRQGLHIVMLKNNEVCAYCAMSKHDFSLPLFRQHSYFQAIPEKGVNALNRLRINNLYSIELLTISPTFRRKYQKFDYYSALRQVLVNLTRDLKAKHVIAPTVKTNNASKGGQKHGQILCENISYKGLLCNLLYFNEQTATDIDDELLRYKIDKLYQSYKGVAYRFKFPDEEVYDEPIRKAS